MHADQGAVISAPGNLTAPAIAAYAFGTGDFSVAALFATTRGGTVVSKKAAPNGLPSCAGWLVVVRPDGGIMFRTDNGFGFCEVHSAPTAALDGRWHHVAAVRQGHAMRLYFDGVLLEPVTGRLSKPGPLSVSGEARLMIGGTDHQLGSDGQFVGTIEDVVLFNRALVPGELAACMFNLLTGSEPGLVGLFSMNGNGNDGSPQRNNATVNGNVSFAPVYHCVWAAGDHAFGYLSITSLDGEPSPGRPAAAQPPAGPGGLVTRTQPLTVTAGAPFLAAAITDGSGRFAFPAGASVRITDPSGRRFDQDADSPSLFVKTAGSGSPWMLVAAAPAAGTWTVEVSAPASVNFSFSMVALPSGDVMGAIQRAMAPVVGPSRKRAMAAGDADPGLWLYLGASALAAVGGIIAVATGVVTIPVAVVALAAYTALSVTMAGQMISDIQKSAPTPPIAADQAAQYMAAGYGGGPRPLAAVVQAVRNKVGVPSTTDPERFASRADMGIDSLYHVHLDIGGEGYHEVWPVYSGFRDAINLNAQTVDSQPPYGPIPMLIQLPQWSEWSPQDQYPFTYAIADYVTMQGAPLTAINVSEIARLVRPEGNVGLWIDRAKYQTQINELASLLQCTPAYSDVPGSGCNDEFNGNAGWPKTCLVNKRGPR